MNSRKSDSTCQFNFESAANQRNLLLDHLGRGDVTTVGARLLGIMSPAARIFELRQKGFVIETLKSKTHTTDNSVTCVAKYRLISEPDSEA